MGIVQRTLNFLSTLIAGKFAEPKYQSNPSQLGQDEVEDNEWGVLPPGTPIVTFSPRALEMQTEVRRLARQRYEASKPVPVTPRKGSKEWRIQEARKRT